MAAKVEVVSCYRTPIRMAIEAGWVEKVMMMEVEEAMVEMEKHPDEGKLGAKEG